MTQALRRTVTVQAGGLIEIRSPDLTPGTLAEVIVLVDEAAAASVRRARARDLVQLMQDTQALPQAQAITEEEIAAEIAAYRSTPR